MSDMAQAEKRKHEQAFEDADKSKDRNKKKKRSRTRGTQENAEESTSAPPADSNVPHRVKTASTPVSKTPKVKHEDGALKSDSRAVPASISTPETSHSERKQASADGLKKSAKKKSATAPVQPTTEVVIKEDLLMSKPHKKHKRKNSEGEQDLVSASWRMLPATGGKFISQDPILTPDDKSLILCTPSAIQVYSTATSLLVRSIQGSAKSSIVSYALDTAGRNQIFVGFDNGSIKKFDFSTGTLLWSTTRKSGAQQFVFHVGISDGCDELFCVEDAGTDNSILAKLKISPSGAMVEETELLERPSLHAVVRYSNDSHSLVLASLTHIYVGQFLNEEPDHSKSRITWNEISLPGRIACFDARFGKESVKTKKHSSRPNSPSVDVAVGLKSGIIEIYTNLLARSKSKTNPLIPRKEHWHRQQPNSLKWSPDGNYLVSGGEETVLAIWQLETNARQFLPHLSSPILNVTISERGSSYVVRLADNSVMVLSIADMKPSANVSGIALDTSPYGASLISQRTVLHPQMPSRLLYAATTEASRPISNPSNVLQTYDASSQTELGRQALSRNLVSTIKVSPNGQMLREPEVTHVGITNDGKWLATVDQWQPPSKSLSASYLDTGDEAAKAKTTQCHLRFWSVSSDDLKWELNTRIDSPVDSPSPLSNTLPLIALATNPTKPQIATAGSDMTIKTWTPKARMRSGLPIRDSNGNQLYTWTCDTSTSLAHSVPYSLLHTAQQDTKTASLAFSEDGSVLASVYSARSEHHTRVHLLDPRTGTIAYSLEDVIFSSKPHLAFCGRYLLGLSDNFVIFDTVALETTFSISTFQTWDASRSLMAVNRASQTVAIAMSERNAKRPSRLVVYKIGAPDSGPLLDTEVPGQVKVLLPQSQPGLGVGGFLVIDGNAAVRRIVPDASTSLVHAPSTKVEQEKETSLVLAKTSIDDMFATDIAQPDVKEEGQMLLENGPEERLDELLKFDSSARVPAPRALFDAVARIVGGAKA